METFFDFIVSSKPIFTAVFLFIFIIATIAITYFKLFKKGWKGIAVSILLISLAIAFIPISKSGKYGFVQTINSLHLVNGKICFIDSRPFETFRRYITGQPQYNNRIFIIDPINGNRECRKFIGYDVNWLKSSANLILIESRGKYKVFDINKKDFTRIIDADYLVKKSSQFSVGIELLEYIKDFIIIHLKNGKTIYYDAFADAVVSKPDDAYYNYACWSCFENKISYIENGRIRELYQLKTDSPGESLEHLQTVIYNKEANVITSEAAFIYGKCNSIFPDEKIIIISSYENTDRKRCLITALDFNLKTRWAIDYNTLNPVDAYTKSNPLITEAIKYNNSIIIGIGGFLYNLDLVTGKIIWKTRL